MRILVIGSGGREHALAWVAAREGHEVHAAPGSDAIGAVAQCHDVTLADHRGLVALAKHLAVDLVIVGPERPLVDGLGDLLRVAGLPTFGPSAAAAALEGSKSDAKAFMRRHEIPTARAIVVSDLAAARSALTAFDGAPPVVKADGLAAGKGVVVPSTMDQAQQAVEAFLGGELGRAGSTIVLEERLRGHEVSFFAITDGVRCRTLKAVADHKRLGDGDTGPNTGGMGAYTPCPSFDAETEDKTLRRIVEPTIAGLRAEGRPFVGVLFFGLMIDERADPWVIEYNARFGDPEIQPLVVGLRGPLIEHLHGAAVGVLEPGVIEGTPAASVVLASAGYPMSPRAGDAIVGLDQVQADPESVIFHAGTKKRADGVWETAGGRVLSVVARGPTLREALERSYALAAGIEFAGMQMRRDIGHCHR